eukprot:TRINITY_DN9669_c0_g2_i1.p1 TRINITY_DN9669_c0_g2~~TRINITY_DN9669_c0_g2_i1.p1  ORF type:complete len:556 (+),score=63.05 TRINITY_DN9669_c0_g2_i1:98-1765(+)
MPFTMIAFSLIWSLLISSCQCLLGGWNAETNYPVEMQGHKIVSFGDLVYVLGDSRNDEYPREVTFFERVWIFNASDFSWSWRIAGGDIPKRRWGYCATFSRGKVFIFGGRMSDYGISYSNEIYGLDIEMFTWEKEKVLKGKFPSKREMMTCGSFEAKLFIYGGVDGDFKMDLWSYDLNLKTWIMIIPKDSKSAADTMFSQMVIHQDVIMIYSGVNLNFEVTSKIWRYNITSNDWISFIEFPPSFRGRYDGAVSLGGSKIYAFGGSFDYSYQDQSNSLDIIDLVSIIFEQPLQELIFTLPITSPNPRVLSSSAFANDRLVIIGGQNYVNQFFYNDVWVFDTHQKKWIYDSMSSYPVSRHSSATAIVSETEIGVFGGIVGWEKDVTFNDLWIFNTASKSWSSLSREKPCRISDTNCAPIVSNPIFGFYRGKFFLIGGSNKAKIMSVFSLETREWSAIRDYNANGKISNLVNPIYAAHNHEIFIWGGTIEKRENLEVYIFDMEELRESFYTPLNQPILHRKALMSSAFIMDEMFCFMDIEILISREIWCWNQGNYLIE